MVYIVIALAIFTIDYILKKKREEHTEEYTIAGEQIKVMTYHNHGAFLNLGEKKPIVVKMISVLLTVFMTILFFMTLGTHGKQGLKLGLSFLLGGAFCNTYDRLKRGYVVDYINFQKAPGKIKTVVFNISDFFIMIGAFLSLLKA